MKKLVFLLICILATTLTASAQSGSRHKRFQGKYKLGLHVGNLYTEGDRSSFDSDKAGFELGYSASITKEIDPILSIRYQFIIGNLSGSWEERRDDYFEAVMMEHSLNFQYDFFELLIPRYDPLYDWHLVGGFGLGWFSTQSQLRDIQTDGKIGGEVNNDQFTVSGFMGIEFAVSEKLTMVLNGRVSILSEDNIDNVEVFSSDFVAFTNLGIAYTL